MTAHEDMTVADFERIGGHVVGLDGIPAAARGLIVHTLVGTIDALLSDLHQVTHIGTARDAKQWEGSTTGQLPQEVLDCTDHTWMRHFLASAIDVSSRLTTGWKPPQTLAEEWVLDLTYLPYINEGFGHGIPTPDVALGIGVFTRAPRATDDLPPAYTPGLRDWFTPFDGATGGTYAVAHTYSF